NKIAPSGTLTKKIHSHEKDDVNQPPRSGPIAAAPAMTAPHTPNATARSLPRNTALTVERVEGKISAPPTPCTTRAQIRGTAASLAAAIKLPRTKTAIPTTNR